MFHKRSQRGALVLLFIVFLGATGLLVANLQLASASFSSRNDEPPEVIITESAHTVRDLLLTNPTLWDHSDQEILTDAIHGLSNSNFLPDNVLIYPALTQIEDNITYRNFVVCLDCEDAVPFDQNGNYDDEAMSAVTHFSIDGYALQREGIFLAKKALADIADVMVRAYGNFARIDDELDLCEIGKDRNGAGCNFYRGCDFDRASILPCSDTTDEGYFRLNEIPLLTGHSFVIWGGMIFVKNSCDEETKECQFIASELGHEEAPLILTAMGPLSTEIRLIVPEPNL